MSPRTLLIVAAAIVLGVPSARAQSVRPDLWCTNGRVNCGAQSGNLLYIGGDFNIVGPVTGMGVPLNPTTGVVLGGFPQVVGEVDKAVSDGTGGWFIGGSFTSVGGIPRSGLAHILSDLTVSSWNPSPNGTVYDLVLSGSTLFVGGLFTNIGGQPRLYLAALDAVTGNATAFTGDANGQVFALALGGSTLYVGGQFNTIGGQTRNGLAALDATTGTVSAWNPSPNSSNVKVLAFDGSTVFVAGAFTSIGLKSRNGLAAVDAVSATVLSWNPNPNNPVFTMVPNGGKLYIGGRFTSIGGQVRGGLAALDETTGVPDPILSGIVVDPGDVRALALIGNTLYVGGQFTSFYGQPRNSVAAVDITTGLATAWDPNVAVSGNSATVFALAVSGSLMYAGGNFTITGGVRRSRIAALDLTTGQATAWNPNLDGPVAAMLANGSTIYVSGEFAHIGPAPRLDIGAIDASTGNATSWNPGADNQANALLISGSTLYAGGVFTSFGSVARQGLGSVLLSSNTPTVWDPHPAPDQTNALAVSGSTIYAAGGFTSIGGQLRNYVGAIDATTGLCTPWDPDADYWVNTLLIDGSTMYVGGGFNSYIGGQSRRYLAALDLTTGNATSWIPPAISLTPTGAVDNLALDNGVLYFSGNFTSVGGFPRGGVAAVDAATGALLAWNPGPFTGGTTVRVNAVLVNGASAYVLGEYWKIGAAMNSNVAEVEAVTVGVPEPPLTKPASLSLSSRPNPLHGAGRIDFYLPHPAEVSLSVYDAAGREVVRLADRRSFPAGWQQVPFEGGSLRSGIYLCRLRASTASVTRRMVLIP